MSIRPNKRYQLIRADRRLGYPTRWGSRDIPTHSHDIGGRGAPPWGHASGVSPRTTPRADRQPIESLFNWINEKTGIQRASKVRSYQGLLVYAFGRLAAAMLLLSNPDSHTLYKSSNHREKGSTEGKLAHCGGLFVFRAGLATQRSRFRLDFVPRVASISNARHISFAKTVGVSRRPVRIGRAFPCHSSLCYSSEDSQG